MAVFGSNFDYGDSPFYKDDGFVAVGSGTTAENDALFLFMPNWKYDVKMSYDFTTIISVKRKGDEQRKALWNRPRRTEEFTLTEYETNGQRLWNYLKYIRNCFEAVPVYDEPCRPVETGLLTGETVIDIRNSIINYYNLRNLTEYVILIDISGAPITGELIALDGANASQLILGSAVSGAFTGAASCFFPVFRGILVNATRRDVTDTTCNYAVTFREFL